MSESETDISAPSAARRAAIQERWFGVGVFLTALIATAYFFPAIDFANSLSRWALTRAIVDDYTLSIDRYEQGTIDKAKVNGHFYCDKAPGASLWGVPAYWLARRVTSLAGGALAEPDGRYITRLWVASLPTAAAAWILWRVLVGQSLTAGRGALVAVAYTLGTCAWPYGVVMFGHQLAAMFTMAAFALLVGRGASPPPARQVALAGVSIGFGVLTEYPVVLAGTILGIYLVWRCPWRLWGWYIAGGAPAAGVLAAYNTAVFGTPWQTGYDHESTKTFQEGMSQGLAGVTAPQWEALWLITGSLSRGLIASSPFLLLAAPGLWSAWRAAPRRAPWVVAAAIGLAFIVFNASYYMPGGGAACGPRHLLPAVPLVAMLCGGVLLPGRSAWWQVAFVGLLIPSVWRQLVAVVIDSHVEPRAANPWLDFWWPVMAGGFQAVSPVARMGGSLFVSVAVLAIILGVMWAGILPARSKEETDSEPDCQQRVDSSPSVWSNPFACLVVLGLAAIAWSPNVLAGPTSGPIHPVVSGGWLRNAGLHESAEHEFRRATEMTPRNGSDRQLIALAWYNLGIIAGQQGRAGEAVDDLHRAAEMAPTNPMMWSALASVLVQVGRHDEAREALDRALALDPEHEAALEVRAQLEANE